MNNLRNQLIQEQQYLFKIIETTKQRLETAPEGSLRIQRNKKYIEYFYYKENTWAKKRQGIYIPHSNASLPQQLAQKTYDQRVLRLAEKRSCQLQRILNDYEDHEIENIYLKEHPERQKLIHPVIQTWEQLLKKWKAIPYQPKGFKENDPLILTNQGERVRSKSEKILADLFFEHHIEYKYECPLHLDGFGIIYPDFTFLSPYTRKEVYWEHNGKIDDPTYARSAIKKIQSYIYNSIYPGESLILTFETENISINTKIAEKYLTRYLI